MALYRVIIPHVDRDSEPARGRQVRYTTLEVEAESQPAAKRSAVSEFEEMGVIGPSGPAAGESQRVIKGDIRVERAPVARRSALDVAVNDLGPSVTCARLVGSINSQNYHRLQETLDELKERGIARLVLDLSGLSYVNSTGLSLFVAAGDMFDLRLAAVPVKINHLLRMIGLDKLFPTFAGVGEAAKAPKPK